MKSAFSQLTANNRSQVGFSLVEVVAFIVIVGIIATAIVSIFGAGVRSAPESRNITLAKQLAQSRMELILARKRVVGFACFTDIAVGNRRFDPCSDAPLAGSCPLTTAMEPPPHSACTPPTGFTITTALDSATCNGGDANYKCITVTVTGPSGAQLAELQSWVVNY